MCGMHPSPSSSSSSVSIQRTDQCPESCLETHEPLLSRTPRMHAIVGRIWEVPKPGAREAMIGSRVLGIWQALATRRAEESLRLTQEAKDARMDYFQAARSMSTSISPASGILLQYSTFVLEVAFTRWKHFSRNLRRTRLCNRQLLRQQQAEQHRGRGDTRPSPDHPHETQATKPGISRVKAVQYAGCVRPPSSRQQQWITQCPRQAWLRGRGRESSATAAAVQSIPCGRSLRCRGKHSMDPANSSDRPGPRPLAPSSAAPTRRPSGKGVVLRTGNDLRLGSSGADNHGKSGQGEKVNIRVAMCLCCDRESQESHERDTSRATSAENRTQKKHPTVHSNPKIRTEDGLANVATPQSAQSPFVVGGPLCAKYPSRWTATWLSAFSMMDPKPLIAWTTATAAVEPGVRQLCSAPGNVPRESGSWKRRGVDSTPSTRYSATPSKHRRTYSPKAITAGEIVYHHKSHNHKLPLSEAAGMALVSRSAFGEISQVLPGRVRAPTSPKRCTTNTVCTAVDRKAGANSYAGDWHVACGRSYLPPHQGSIGPGDGGGEEPREASSSSMCFGQYRLLVD